jgi:iron-sulfur cluster repair protein YtfE (RIC family)
MKEVFDLQLPDLLFFVKESCHENLHHTLVEVRGLCTGHDYPIKLTSFIRTFIQDLQRHLVQEENQLFIPVKKGRFHTAEFSLNVLMDEHDKMKLDLLAIRQMTNNYEAALENDFKKIHLYSKLKEMDRIILNHIQIENHVLFPMIKTKC